MNKDKLEGVVFKETKRSCRMEGVGGAYLSPYNLKLLLQQRARGLKVLAYNKKKEKANA